MKLALGPDEQSLQEKVRAFLAEHCPDPGDLPHRQLLRCGRSGRVESYDHRPQQVDRAARVFQRRAQVDRPEQGPSQQRVA